MSETCRGHLRDKIIVKLFASSWYIFLTYLDKQLLLHSFYFLIQKVVPFKSSVAIAQAEFNKKKALYTRKLDLNLRAQLVQCYIWSIVYMVLNLSHFGKWIGCFMCSMSVHSRVLHT